jgi:hypothetical protein
MQNRDVRDWFDDLDLQVPSDTSLYANKPQSLFLICSIRPGVHQEVEREVSGDEQTSV